MRTRTAAFAALITTAALAAAPAALAAATATGSARHITPAFANPGDTNPSLALAVSPGGEPESATVGPGGSLWYSALKGGWHRMKVAGTGSAFSGPSVFAGLFGTADIAVEGPHNTLQFYALSKGHWHHTQVAGKQTTYSGPSIASGPRGLAIAVEGRNHTLRLYSLSGGHWHSALVSGAQTAFSTPSLVIRSQNQASAGNPAGQVDIAVRGAADSLTYYNSKNGHWQVHSVSTAGTAFSAPSMIVVRGLSHEFQGVAYIVAEGASHSMLAYQNNTIGHVFAGQLVAGTHSDFSAPSVSQGDSLREVGIAFRGVSSSISFYYFDTAIKHWVNDVIVGATGTVNSAPALIFHTANPPGRDDIIFQGIGNTQWYYVAKRPASSALAPQFTGTRIAGPGTTFGG